MKHLILFLVLILSLDSFARIRMWDGPITIGTSKGKPDASAILDLQSTRGFLVPRMDTSSRDAISSPAAGLELFNTDTASKEIWNGTAWESIGGGGGGIDAWTASTTYSSGDVVYSSSSLIYVANQNFTSDSLAIDADILNNYWDVLSSKIALTNPAVDNSLVRVDGTSDASIQDSNILISDTDEMTGVTLLQIDDLTFDGGTISSVNDMTFDSGANYYFPDLTPLRPVKVGSGGELTASQIELDNTADITNILAAANGGTGLDGSAASNGQLLIGNGTGYSLSTLTGTADQVNILNGSGSITLSLGQDLSPDNSPTFVDLTLTGLTQDSVPYIGSGGLLTESNTNFNYDGSTLSLSGSGATTLLDLSQSGSGTSLNINNSGSGDFIIVDTTKLVLDNAGNLGLGVSPDDTLDVVGTAQIAGSLLVDDLTFDGNIIGTTSGSLIIDPDSTSDIQLKSPLTLTEFSGVETPGAGVIGVFANSSSGSLYYKDENGVSLPVDRQELFTLLSDGNFEKRYSGNELGAWTLNGGTADLTSDAFDGSQALVVTLAGQTLDLSSDSFNCDQYNDRFIGFKCNVRSSDTDATDDLQVCGSRGGIEQDCISYTNLSNWQRLEPGFFGNTGEGCSVNIKTAVDMTGDIVVDGCSFSDDLTSDAGSDPFGQICILSDLKSSGTAGGNCSSGNFIKRDLNDATGDCSWVNLSSSTFTLDEGKYKVQATVPLYRSGFNQTLLLNNTDTIEITPYGTSEYSSNGDGHTIKSFINVILDIATSKNFEVRHYCSAASSSIDFGRPASSGKGEVYTQVIIQRLR